MISSNVVNKRNNKINWKHLEEEKDLKSARDPLLILKHSDNSLLFDTKLQTANMSNNELHRIPIITILKDVKENEEETWTKKILPSSQNPYQMVNPKNRRLGNSPKMSILDLLIRNKRLRSQISE